MNFYLEIEPDKVTFPHDLSICVIEKEKNLLFKKYYKNVSIEKEKIDQLENSENWDKMKKIGNPYELIYTNYNKKRKNDSISRYIPISRSYFKMWEIFHNFDLFSNFPKTEQHVFAHLAEGPGGFMEASYNHRLNIVGKSNMKDIFYGITLKPVSDFIPDWNKIKKIFYNSPNIKIDYGNLYIMNDIKNYLKNFKYKKAHLVTADGGFDYSSDFNGQEINSCQIIYSECIVALNVLREKGCFVCKVFDLFSITMIQILYILSYSFEKIHIYKPDTSRPANSEKYLVCINYKNNLTEQMKTDLLNVIGEWNFMSDTIKPSESMRFKNMRIDNSFIRKINEYNQKYIDNQMYYLNKTIEIAQNKPNKEKYYEIIENQVNNAIEWCNKYGVEINKNSIYYKKNIE
jgi:23S rRNA U2552 (ribose-2'-O)-methylase RlmE/FtsJ